MLKLLSYCLCLKMGMDGSLTKSTQKGAKTNLDELQLRLWYLLAFALLILNFAGFIGTDRQKGYANVFEYYWVTSHESPFFICSKWKSLTQSKIKRWLSDLLAQRIGKSNNMRNEQFQKKRGIISNYYEWTVQKKGCVYYSPFLILCIDLWKQKQQDSTILHFASGLLHFSLLVSKNKHLFGVFLPAIRRH